MVFEMSAFDVELMTVSISEEFLPSQASLLIFLLLLLPENTQSLVWRHQFQQVAYIRRV